MFVNMVQRKGKEKTEDKKGRKNYGEKKREKKKQFRCWLYAYDIK